MKIHINAIAKFFIFFSMLFYLKIIGFLGSSITNSMKGDFDQIAAGNTINQVSGILLLLLATILIYKVPQINARSFIKHFWPFALIIIFFLISLKWSEVPFISLRRIIAFTTLIITAYVITQLFTAPYILELIYKTIVFTIVLGFTWTILQGNPISIGLGDQASGMKRIFYDKNGAARIYAYGLLIAFALKKYKTYPQLLALLTILLALATSHSASAIVLVFAGISIIILFRSLKGNVSQINFITLILALIALLTASYLASVLYDFLLELLDRDPTLTNRAIIWELLTPYILDKFYFGYGYGAFWASSAVEWFVDRWGFIGNAHSGYFEVILNGGIALFSLLIILITVFFRNNLALFVRSHSSGLEPFYISLLLLQLVINYIGYLILNHSAFDMFLFTVVFFLASYEYHNKIKTSSKKSFNL